MSSEIGSRNYINTFDEYLSLILYSMEFVVMVFLCILYVYLFIKDRNTKTHVIILISLILSMIYCVLSFIFIDGNVLLFGQYLNKKCFYINLISGIIILERTCLYIFNTYKLSISFKDSVFEINRHKSIISYGILALICCGYFISVYVASYNELTYSCHKNIRIGIILTIFVIIDILCAFISVKIFAVKINKLLAMQMFPEMKFLVYKLSILSIIDIFSSIIFILIPGILLHEYIKPHKLFCIDLIINNACLILTFGKSNKIYMKLCCCFQCEMENFWSSLITLRSRSPIDTSPTPNTPVNTPANSPSNANISDKIVAINNTSDDKDGLSNKQNSAFLTESIYALSKQFNPKRKSNKNAFDNDIEIIYKHSNTSKLPYKTYSNSTNNISLSSKDSITVSQQILINKQHDSNVIIPNTIKEMSPSNEPKRPDSIDEFVSAMVELQEPTGYEGNEVDTPNDDDNDTDTNWNQLSIVSDNDDDTYETLKRNTPSTCVKQMKELGIIM